MKRSTQVLIVDDREVARLTLRNVLLGFNCEFSEAQCGERALELMSEVEFDAIFLDLGLPDFSGIEVLRKAREAGIVKGKVIILTGRPEPPTEAEASSLGAFKYLRKPLDWKEIRNTFAEAISDSAPSLPEQRPGPQAGRVAGGTSGRARAAVVADANRVSRPRLLILDDNRPWLDTMQQVLGNDFDLIMTTSADEACKWARKEHFALVVLDMRLVGGVSGLDVLSRMRRAVPDLQAIILTQHPDYESAVESGRRGALDYVSKNDLAILPGMVRRILSENPEPTRVFLSYERTDSAKVMRLYEKLMVRGFLPWMDVKSISAGKKWKPEIRKAIERSDYFVFCISRSSLYKEGTMRAEIKQALERQNGLLEDSVFFVPVRLEDCEIVEPFSEFQIVDLFRKDGFTKLIHAVSLKRRTSK